MEERRQVSGDSGDSGADGPADYFRYDYPAAGDVFSITLDGAPSPFGSGLHLLRIGLKTTEVPLEQRQPANLVFLIDVSGSMSSPDKLGLVQFTLERLVRQLAPSDTLGIVTYTGANRLSRQRGDQQRRDFNYRGTRPARPGEAT